MVYKDIIPKSDKIVIIKGQFANCPFIIGGHFLEEKSGQKSRASAAELLIRSYSFKEKSGKS